MKPRIILGDSIGVMRRMPEASIDAIVTDPPYGLGFMGKAWDDLPPGEEWARECLRNPPGSTNPRVAMGDGWRADAQPREAVGRWPANVVLDEDQAAALDAQSGALKS